MIAVNRKDFLSALKLVTAAVEKRGCVPVLRNVHASTLPAAHLADGDCLVLEATDFDTTLTARVPCSGTLAEATLLPAPHQLHPALAAAVGDDLQLTADGAAKTARLQAGDLALDVRTGVAADFPTAKRPMTGGFTATLGAEALAQLARLMPAISTEKVRYYLNGIHLVQLDGWTFQAQATDGHRLFLATLALPDAAGDFPANCIIPRRFLQAALGELRRGGGPVKLWCGSPQLDNAPDAPEKTLRQQRRAWSSLHLRGHARGVDLACQTKLIDGTFPDVSRVIPQDVPYRLECDRAALLWALAQINHFRDQQVRAVRFSAVPDGLALRLEHVELGTAAVQIAATHQLPRDFTIAFNGKYLVEALRALTGERVVFGLTDAGAPTRVEDPQDTGFLAVIMPMRF